MRSLNLYQPELVPVLSRIVYKFGWLEMRGGAMRWSPLIINNGLRREGRKREVQVGSSVPYTTGGAAETYVAAVGRTLSMIAKQKLEHTQLFGSGAPRSGVGSRLSATADARQCIPRQAGGPGRAETPHNVGYRAQRPRAVAARALPSRPLHLQFTARGRQPARVHAAPARALVERD